ncbi:MAG: hypothetical protein ACWGKN_02600 [Desulfoprunum sp.]|jgi:hypothetical protein
MKKIICCSVLAAMLMTSGCAGSRKYAYNYQAPPQAVSCSIIDSRPEQEKKGEVLSMLVSSSNYGIYRIGDSQLIPDRITFLKDKLEAAPGGKLQGKAVTVTHFEILNNLQKHLRSSVAFGAVGGIAGGLIYAGVTDDPTALIDVNLEISVDGKPVGAHVAHGYNFGKWEGATDEIVAREIHLAMNKAVEVVIGKI